MDPETAAIKATNLSKHFGSNSGAGTPVVGPIDLEIPKGQFVSLLGPSGCGKSTLLNIMASLLNPSEGEISFDGHLRPAPDRTRGFVFQEAALFPWRDVLSNVTIALEGQGESRAKVKQKARDYLSLVGLQDYVKMYPEQLSGGMRQRVMIARTLAMGSQTLLMDEPFGALDALTRESMQEELLNIWQQTGTTVVFVTHSIEEAIYLSQRILVFSARPATIVEDCVVPDPYPRPYEMRSSPMASELRTHLHQLLSGGPRPPQDATRQEPVSA